MKEYDFIFQTISEIQNSSDSAIRSIDRFLQAIVKFLNVQNAWILFYDNENALVEVGYPIPSLPSTIRDKNIQSIDLLQSFQVFRTENFEWIVFPLIRNGFLVLQNTRPFDINDFLGDKIHCFIVYIHELISAYLNEQSTAQFRQFVLFQDTFKKIATSIINIPASEMDHAINNALETAGKLIDADRVFVFDYLLDKWVMSNTFEWCSNEVQPQINQLQNIPMDDLVDDLLRPHQNGERILVNDLFELDPNNFIFQLLQSRGIQSVVSIPLRLKNRVLGFVGFASEKSKRKWNEHEIRLLNVLAELIVNIKLQQEKDNEIKRLFVQAEQANQAKSDFLSNMSHEIRTPLSGIYNALYLLSNSALSQDQQDYLDIANASVESLSGIVNNVLDLAKIEAGKVEFNLTAFDLEEEIFQIAKMVEYSALEKGLFLMIDLDFKIPSGIIFDRLRLRQIILNLLHNGIKFTDQGSIVVKTKLLEQFERSVLIQFQVIDTGVGISPQLIQTITEKFVQVDSSGQRKYNGTGLGLSIVKHLVEYFGGQLTIQSDVGKGSIFSFALEFDIDPDSVALESSAFSGMHMVFLDHDDQHGDHPARFFQSMGFEIHMVDSQDDSPIGFPVDYIIYKKPLRSMKVEEVQRFLYKHSITNSRIGLLNTEPSIVTTDEWKTMGLDFILTMPTTRTRVEQLLRSKPSSTNLNGVMKKTHSNQKVTLSGVEVMVVDDNRINRRALELILSSKGIHVTLAQNGYEAIDLAKQRQYDIILMDIQMPGIDGYETTKVLRKLDNNNRSIPIYAVSANALTTVRDKAYEVGMNDVITKPIKPDLLLKIIDNHVNQTKPSLIKSFSLNIPSDLEVFSDTRFYSQFEDKTDLSRQIATAFLEDYEKDIQLILSSVKKRSFADIRKTAHFFKGSAAYVGAERLVWICQELIEQAKSENLAQIKVLSAMLKKETVAWSIEYAKRERRGELT